MSEITHNFSCKLNSICRLFSKVVSLDHHHHHHHHHHQGGNIEDDWEYIEVLDRELEVDHASIPDLDVVMLDLGEPNLSSSISLEQGNSSKMKYTILSKVEVRQRLEEKITKVCDVFLLPRNEAAILLHHFKWSVSRTNDEWLACEEKVRKALGLFARPVAETPSNAVAVACSVCHAEFPIDFMCSVSCGHQICRPCWKYYIRQAINEGAQCLTLRCPEPLCDAAVGFDLIELLSSEDDKNKFENHLLRAYIAHRRKAKWCPAPDCNYVVFSSNGGEGNVTCPSSHSLCWSCSGEGHAPVDCNTVAQWTSEKDRQSQNWVLANTVLCPRCKFSFEKEACLDFYTKCTSCKLRFCSGCGDYWFGPEAKFHLCNRNDDNNSKEIAKKSLERYNYYYELWAICESSRENALIDLDMFQNFQCELLCAIFNLSPKDLDFLVEALQQVAECWQLLKWMHVYGYFLADDEHIKKRLFEFMQEEAIVLVKRLHKLIEEVEDFLCYEVRSAQFVEYRSNIIMLTRVTRNYIDKLVDGLMAGISEVVCISELSARLKLLELERKPASTGKAQIEAQDRAQT